MPNRPTPILLSLTATIAPFIAQPAIAQVAPCQPPNANEYLLMVIHQGTTTPPQLQQALPRGATTVVCDYLGKTVTRVSGFASAEVANAWAQYFSELGGMQAFVARPADQSAAIAPMPAPTSPAPTIPAQGGTATLPAPVAPVAQPAPAIPAVQPSLPAPTAPTPQPAPPPAPVATPQPIAPAPIAYNPRSLGAGYVVLVDYSNRPEVAADVQQAISGRVGVAVYQQRPYLLAAYTPDLVVAAGILRNLSDRNFSAMIIDSRRVILLSPAVAGLQ